MLVVSARGRTLQLVKYIAASRAACHSKHPSGSDSSRSSTLTPSLLVLSPSDGFYNQFFSSFSVDSRGCIWRLYKADWDRPHNTSFRPEAPDLPPVLQLLHEREGSFKDYRDGHRRLINWLLPLVWVVHGFSSPQVEVGGVPVVSPRGLNPHLCSYTYESSPRLPCNSHGQSLLVSTFSS